MNLTIVLSIILFLMVKENVSFDSVIWDKTHEKFVPISSIKEFHSLYLKLTKISDNGKHNFQNENLYFVYFHEKDIFEFSDNDERVTGVCGDIWTLLSEYLNFTMVLKKSEVTSLGSRNRNELNFTGLLGMVQRKEYMIIPKMEAYLDQIEAVDFSTSLWKTEHRLFIQPIYEYKLYWLIELFSWKLWISLLLFYISLSCFGFISEKYFSESVPDGYLTSATDFFFYTFGTLCDQGDFLFNHQKKHKILVWCRSMFSWLLLTTYSSTLIVYISQKTLIPPFDSFETLLYDSDYIILAEKNSAVHSTFKMKSKPIFSDIMKANRILFLSSQDEIQNMICSSDKINYAMLESAFIKKHYLTCKIETVGTGYFNTWIVAGFNKDFKYKKSIDIGIMRLRESGIIEALKSRWLQLPIVNIMKKPNKKSFAPITFRQVTFIIFIYLWGLLSSIAVLIMEILIYKLNQYS